MKVKIITIFLIILLFLSGCATAGISDMSFSVIESYKIDLVVYDLAVSDISPSGFTATFRTEESQPLVVEWTVYPSDIFMIDYCGDGHSHRFVINKYPEGGTIVYRITDGIDCLPRHGTEWLYQDLPRSTNPNAILPPPYMPTELR